ncbi:sulfite exporter TauE/SafE family protein [Paenibacillus sediminis]|uniref:Probable membrane transporter protein n=2 Tax=Paenibacillus sediminis TaxID=664909 RepID=A0ABS4H0Q5_9BACL|nr:sulfite exporter TauE/SafE family protein [Paenibacillus sediminis]MBP1936104.1 putative membrane protein YfcA [Paenibacillus sediminis]
MEHIVLFIIGLIGSFFSGLLGIGGAIINYPLLLYVPVWFNVDSFSAKEVADISIFQVFFSSLAGVLAYRFQTKDEGPVVHKRLVMNMGISILVGSLIGSLSSNYLPNETINIVYGVLAIIAVILMLFPNHGEKKHFNIAQIRFNPWIAAACAFLVGIASGIVGAGGAFMLIPIMLTVLKIPTRVTVASSLAIVFISAVGGMTGKIAAGGIPFWPTLFVVIGSLLGAPLGSFVSRRLNVKYLRVCLAVLIAATAIKIWVDILT